jgi:hypothetical protein
MDTLPYQQVFACVRDTCREHPDVQLTPEQLQGLTGAEDDVCRRVLEDLARAQFLTVAANGRYVRGEHSGAGHLYKTVLGDAGGYNGVATRRDE